MSGGSLTREIVEVEDHDLPRAGWGLALARGIYYRPERAWPRVAFIAAHYELDFSQHYMAELIAHRGYGFLAWNTRFCGREPYFLMDRALVDLDRGVRWLRDHAVELVVLLGNSGGGSLLAAYQAQSGRPVIRSPFGLALAAGVDQLLGGDLYLSVAAHPGRPEVLTGWLDPAVVDESDPVRSDPAIDMYNPNNGPPYQPDFVERYREAQRARNGRITEWCMGELQRLSAAGYPDRLFTVHRTWADPRFMDSDLDPSDRPTPACYRGDPARANRGVEGIGMVSTLRTWLAMWSLDECQARAGECLALVETPALVIQASADTGVFSSDAKAIFDALGSADKQLVEMPGDHYFRRPGNARDGVAELIASWVAERSAGA